MDDMVDVDVNGNPVKNVANAGAYQLSELPAFYYDKGIGCSATVFFRPGIADGDTAPIDWAYEAGLRMAHGWVPTRPDSEIGLRLHAGA